VIILITLSFVVLRQEHYVMNVPEYYSIIHKRVKVGIVYQLLEYLET